MPKLVFLDDTIANKIFELRNENKSIAEISNLLNLKYSQVVYLINKFHIPKKYFWLSAFEKDFILNNHHTIYSSL
jgi:hypothetical protein